MAQVLELPVFLSQGSQLRPYPEVLLYLDLLSVTTRNPEAQHVGSCAIFGAFLKSRASGVTWLHENLSFHFQTCFFKSLFLNQSDFCTLEAGDTEPVPASESWGFK